MNIGPYSREHDLWGQVLRLVFPGPVTDWYSSAATWVGHSTWANIYQSVFLAISSIVIFVAIGLLIYRTIVVVSDAAATGRDWIESIGVWTIVRTLVGIGLVLPVIGGMSLAQVLVIQLSIWSGQAANTVWRLVSSHLGAITAEARSSLSDDYLATIAQAIAIDHLCGRLHRDQDSLLVQAARAVGIQHNPHRDLPLGLAYTRHNNCFELQIQYSDAHTVREHLSDLRATWRATLDDAHQRFEPIANSVVLLMRGAVSNGNRQLPTIPELRQQYAEWRDTTIQQWRYASTRVANSRVNTASAGYTRVVDQGWAAAPILWVRQLSTIRDVWLLANPDVSIANIERFQALLATRADTAGRGLRQSLEMLAIDSIAQGAQIENRENIVTERSNLNISGVRIAGIAVFPSIDFRQGSITLQLASWGQDALTSGLVIIGGAPLVRSVSQILAVVPHTAARVAGTAGQRAASVASTVGYLLIASGITFGYVLPLLMTLFLIVFVGQSVLLVFISILGAPIWAVAHITGAGKSWMTNNIAPGYQVLVNVFCRIPITFLAFIVGVILLDALLWMTAWILDRALYSNPVTGEQAGIQGSIVGLIIILFAAISLALTVVTSVMLLTNRVLSLINIRPIEGDHYDPIAHKSTALGAAVGTSIGRLTGGTGGGSTAGWIGRRLAGDTGSSGRVLAGPQPGPASKLPRR